MDTPLLKRRTFKDYLEALGTYNFSEKFYEFTSWVRFIGYVPNHFGNNCFMFENGSLNDFYLLREQIFRSCGTDADLEKSRANAAQILDFIDTIDTDEDRWGLDDDDAINFQFKKPVIEKFIRVLFPHTSFRCPLLKTNQAAVLKSFERVLSQNMMKYDGYSSLLPLFLEDLDAFLSDMLDNYQNLDIWLVENSCAYWQDIGFVINKRNCNDFYMYLISDDN